MFRLLDIEGLYPRAETHKLSRFQVEMERTAEREARGCCSGENRALIRSADTEFPTRNCVQAGVLPRQKAPRIRHLPPRTSQRQHPAGIWLVRDGAQRVGTTGTDVRDDWRQILREAIRIDTDRRTQRCTALPYPPERRGPVRVGQKNPIVLRARGASNGILRPICPTCPT
jgi:hypothetical protein